ncbi:hypothetical protein BCR36DRAFT_584832 [Piromyces finnis]|uniref:Letm1 RBD domain-containing protein n=1 Tax=Piromyces finnis TaxID=1754191 RepID=A0A1Y1V4P5_9FUNG|nr:hypothetical protein BCR36DRAFT_584832 [Piromyces finnis]|eukprot:ORX47318.1 hypothetical protein BCR36DRAFT_584832 [Piromyces finnis]
MNYIRVKNVSFGIVNSIPLKNGKYLFSQLANSQFNKKYGVIYLKFNSTYKKTTNIVVNRNLNTVSTTKKYSYQHNVLINSNTYGLREQLYKTIKYNLYNCSKCNLYAQPKSKKVEYDNALYDNNEKKVNDFKRDSSDNINIERQNINNSIEDELTIILNSNDNFFVKEWKQLKSFVWHLIIGSQVLIHEVEQSMELKRKRMDNIPLSRRESLLIRRSFHDSICVFPFFLLLITEPYYLYLLCSIFPTLVPSVYITPYILKKNIEKNKKHRKKIAKRASKLESWVSFDISVLNNENKVLQLDDMVMRQFDVDSLSWWHLKSCAGYLGLFGLLPKSILKIRIDEYLEYIKSDDEFICEEGIESLTLDELRQANEQRGFNSLGLTKEKLISNLTHWIDFYCNNEKVEIPRTVMILSHIYYDNVKYQSELKKRKELRKLKRKRFLNKYLSFLS